MKRSIISITCLLLTISLNLTAEELGIDEIISIAIENSEAIKSEDTKSGKDEYEKKAVFMRFFPTISLEAKLLKLEYFPEPDKLTVDLSETVQQLGEAINASSPIPINLPTELPPKEIDLGVPTHHRTLDLTVVQPLTPLWGIYQGYKALELKSEISKLKSELTKDKIKLEIVKIYNSYNMLSDILKLLDESFEQLDRYEKNAEKFHKAGLIDETALYKIKVERAALEVEKEKYLGNQSVIKAALAMFMNRDEESFEIKYDKPEFREITKSEDEIIEAQASNRTEMLMLNKNSEIQERLNKKAIQNFIPQVGLTFGFKKNWDSTLINPGRSHVLRRCCKMGIRFRHGKTVLRISGSKSVICFNRAYQHQAQKGHDTSGQKTDGRHQSPRKSARAEQNSDRISRSNTQDPGSEIRKADDNGNRTSERSAHGQKIENRRDRKPLQIQNSSR